MHDVLTNPLFWLAYAALTALALALGAWKGRPVALTLGWCLVISPLLAALVLLVAPPAPKQA